MLFDSKYLWDRTAYIVLESEEIRLKISDIYHHKSELQTINTKARPLCKENESNLLSYASS